MWFQTVGVGWDRIHVCTRRGSIVVPGRRGGGKISRGANLISGFTCILLTTPSSGQVSQEIRRADQ
jgi:hypothetical protein